MTTQAKPRTEYERKLTALREAGEDPTDPMYHASIRVLKRREFLISRGYAGEVALDKALAETNLPDETTAA